MNDEDAGWRPIETAPQDEEILVFSNPWGVIIASFRSEFGEWMSRMQVPVSIKAEELPTHWRPMPAPPVTTSSESPEGSSDGPPHPPGK